MTTLFALLPSCATGSEETDVGSRGVGHWGATVHLESGPDDLRAVGEPDDGAGVILARTAASR